MAKRSVWLWVRDIALGLVILAFIAFFGLPSGTGPRSVVAEVGDESISRDVFEFFREQFARQLAPNLPDEDPQRIRQAVDSRALDAVLQRYVLAEEARRIGLSVSDEEVREEILSEPNFRTEGRFDRELFERFAARNMGSTRDYLEQIRLDLLLRKFRRLVTSPARVSDIDLREAVDRSLVTVRLRYARSQASGLAPRIEVSEEEARAFAEAQPERVRAEFEKRSFEFRKEEAVHARHILFGGEGAAERAAAALERLRAGEDFADLARELSDDQATRAEGGDLGFVPRGRMMTAFEEAAYALEPGTVSEPVETTRGFHLIQVLERQEASETPFEEVKIDLATRLLREERAARRAREAADAMASRLREGQGFVEAAEASGLEVEETLPFRYAEPLVPGIGRIPGLKEAAFELTSEDPVSPQVFGSGDTYYLISLLERQEPDEDAVRVSMSTARDQLLNTVRNQLEVRWYRDRRDALERSGDLKIYPLYPVN